MNVESLNRRFLKTVFITVIFLKVPTHMQIEPGL